MKTKPDLDPDAMLAFAALARAGGVRGAARDLGTPRSTLSRKLVELEAQVGAPLVVRTARRFALTEIGVTFAERCEALEKLVRDSRDLVGRASSEPAGTLRVAVAPVLGEEILAPILAELVSRYPRLSVEGHLAVGYVDLRRGSIDVALRASKLEDASDLFALRLGTSTSGCYVSPAYAKAQGTPRSLSDLAKHDCILVGAPPDAWTFRAGGRDVRVPVSGRLRIDNFRVARDAAAKGAGVVRVATVFAEPLVRSGALVPVLEKFWLPVPVFAVHAGPNPPLPRVRAFIEAARKAVEKALPARGSAAWKSA